VIEPENQEEVKRLQKRFQFVSDLYHFIFVSEDCLYKNFSNETQLVTSKGVKLLRQRGQAERTACLRRSCLDLKSEFLNIKLVKQFNLRSNHKLF